MRQLLAILALSAMMTTSALAHDALLEHDHAEYLQLAHADHKPHTHIKKIKKTVKEQEITQE